jgi:hypothetical protein
VNVVRQSFCTGGLITVRGCDCEASLRQKQRQPRTRLPLLI